ncbi:NAD-dependent epimerase/dehydratase family protein [Paenibacillus sp. GCM10012307]|uniref:NAD-dependent epimerase/dehydratase family protein n=1 Tax=Paenibacillus roseus TaxID=2798579 RepID=A0A934MLD4_9BACL|nr:NAD-dependent epimerase/dehydratase family protein [Paenibacillus roseus]MBJ6362065.1 NAD-dependent epimerase/dehydratase family protein [Paenibacillus roseus]
MRAIVTGGAGFIGSHLAAALALRGDQVTVVDNLASGNVKKVHPSANFQQLDIRSEEARQLVASERPDVVFHLAAQTDVQQSLQHSCYDADVNVRGTINLLEGCREAGSKLVFASTSAVYGDLEKLQISEQDPARPISFYGLSKWAAESYIQLYSKLYGLPYTVLRFSNVFGPGQTAKGEGGVVAVFLERLKSGEPVSIHGDGGQTRDFIYVGDIVSALLAAATRGEGQTLHASTAVSVAVNELADLLGRIHGKELVRIRKPGRKGDIRHSCLDNRNARETLLWQPEHTLKEGLTTAYLAAMQNDSRG